MLCFVAATRRRDSWLDCSEMQKGPRGLIQVGALVLVSPDFGCNRWLVGSQGEVEVVEASAPVRGIPGPSSAGTQGDCAGVKVELDMRQMVR
jgi:hypothetical protein